MCGLWGLFRKSDSGVGAVCRDSGLHSRLYRLCLGSYLFIIFCIADCNSAWSLSTECFWFGFQYHNLVSYDARSTNRNIFRCNFGKVFQLVCLESNDSLGKIGSVLVSHIISITCWNIHKHFRKTNQNF